MTIVSATLKHLARRRWKLALVVFVLGVALVAVSRSFDVIAIAEEGEAAADAVEEAGAPSPEQVEAMGRGLGVMALLLVLYLGFSLGAVLVGCVMPGGVVADEWRSGATMLWGQHPMPLGRFYMHRYLGVQIANLSVQAIFGATVVLANFPVLPATELGVILQIGLEGALACAISFAVSALGIRRASFLALAYYAVSWIVSDVVSVATGDILSVLVFPTFAIEDFVAGLEPGTPWSWRATGIVLYHFTLWTAVALLGLRRIDRRPLKL